MVAVFTWFIFFLLLPSSFCISASPHAFREKQPDGSTTTQLHLNGDESFSFVTDSKGYTVVRDDTGWDVYAVRDDRTGNLKPSGFRVGKIDPRQKHQLVKGMLPDRDVIATMRNRYKEPEPRSICGGQDCNRVLGASSENSTGTLKNLVLLMRFADHKKRVLPSKQDFDTLMNNPGGHSTLAPTGSVRDVYLESSNGKLVVESVIYDWITLSKDEAYYADGNSGLTKTFFLAIHEALDHLDNDRKFSFDDFDQDGNGEIDAITIVHSGFGAEWGGLDCDKGQKKEDRIWSHQRPSMGTKWCGTERVCVDRYLVSPGLWGTCGSSISRIGVFAHELGHFLGLQDLYDGSGGKGIGSYGLMGNCWGFDGSQYYPPLMDPWSRIELGWIAPTVLNKSGRYSLEGTTSGQVYKIDDGFPSQEYLLIENRQPVGFDAKIPQGGILIYHIDEKADYSIEGYPGQRQWPQNGKHYRIALLQADGAFHLEKGIGQGDRMDVWHGDGASYIGPSENQDGPWPNTDSYQAGNIEQTGIVIRDISKSDARMSFSLVLKNSPTEPPTTAPTSTPTTCDGAMFRCTIVTDNFPGETSWTLTKDGSISISGNGYNQVGMVYSTSKCIPQGSYLFTIRDSSYDGLCCGYGKGSYNITRNGMVLRTGSSFRGSEHFQFDVGPSPVPTYQLTSSPSSILPTASPTVSPTERPSSTPIGEPSLGPSLLQSGSPSMAWSHVPSIQPTFIHSKTPSTVPSSWAPSSFPTTIPSVSITTNPSWSPSSSAPSDVPSMRPSAMPTAMPSAMPSAEHSWKPSSSPSSAPSSERSHVPSIQPSFAPSILRSASPSSWTPSCTPTVSPSTPPTNIPSWLPSSSAPSDGPSKRHSISPSTRPVRIPSHIPSSSPSVLPAAVDSSMPTAIPSSHPSNVPSIVPFFVPSSNPSDDPSLNPTFMPTNIPISDPSRVTNADSASLPSAKPRSATDPALDAATDASLHDSPKSVLREGNAGSNTIYSMKHVLFTVVALGAGLCIVVASYFFIWRGKGAQQEESCHREKFAAGGDVILTQVRVLDGDNSTLPRAECQKCDSISHICRETANSDAAIPVIDSAQLPTATTATSNVDVTAKDSDSESSLGGIWLDNMFQFLSTSTCATGSYKPED